MSFTVDEPFNGKLSWCTRRTRKGVDYSYFAQQKPWPIPATQKRIIISLAVGKHDYDSICAESRARYAAKLSCELYEMRHFTGVLPGLIHWEKFRIRKWLEDGYRVLYLDNDTIVMPGCPDLFQITPPEYFVAMDENGRHWLSDFAENKWLSWKVAELCGYPIAKSYYTDPSKPSYQAGVYLASPRHAPLFELPKDPAILKQLWDVPLGDQTYMNYMIQRFKTPVLEMGREFNCMRPGIGEVPWIVHSAGISEDKRLKFLSCWV
jgi:hypothetical protein